MGTKLVDAAPTKKERERERGGGTKLLMRRCPSCGDPCVTEEELHSVSTSASLSDLPSHLSRVGAFSNLCCFAAMTGGESGDECAYECVWSGSVCGLAIASNNVPLVRELLRSTGVAAFSFLRVCTTGVLDLDTGLLCAETMNADEDAFDVDEHDGRHCRWEYHLPPLVAAEYYHGKGAMRTLIRSHLLWREARREVLRRSIGLWWWKRARASHRKRKRDV